MQRHLPLWFGDSSRPELAPQTDETIRLRFGALTRAAADGELKPGSRARDDGWR